MIRAPQARQNRQMIEAPDFKRRVAHPIKPTGGPAVLLVTLEDTAKFTGLMEPWRQARPYWDRCAVEILKAARTGKRSDIVGASRSLEVALRRENRL
jgi:hypothetical protein